MSYWPLIGVAVVVVGFALRMNPVLVVVSAGFASGFAAGKSLLELLALLGTSFLTNRALMLFVFTLPVIGVLERAGLREHAQRWIATLRGLTLARLLIGVADPGFLRKQRDQAGPPADRDLGLADSDRRVRDPCSADRSVPTST
jgi:hypothetical protein